VPHALTALPQNAVHHTPNLALLPLLLLPLLLLLLLKLDGVAPAGGQPA